MLKRILFVNIALIILAPNLFSTSIEDVPSKYFRYFYVAGQGCQPMGGSPSSAKESLSRTPELQDINIIEANNGVLRFSFMKDGQSKILTFAEDIPTCAGIDAYYRSRR